MGIQKPAGRNPGATTEPEVTALPVTFALSHDADRRRAPGFVPFRFLEKLLSTSALFTAALVLGFGAPAHAGSTINEGETLTVSDSSDLGVGDVTVNGGDDGATIAFDGSLSIANPFIVTGVAIFDVGGTDATTVGGVIADGSEFGSVIKTGDGTLVLSGANTYSGRTTVEAGTLSVTGSIDVGGDITANNGTLNISGTASSSHGFVAYDTGSTASVTVSGASASWTVYDLLAGIRGSATLTISDGGEVDDTIASIGLNSSATGTVTVTGAGSTWTNSNTLWVGDYGEGTVNVEDGGSVSAKDGSIGLTSSAIGEVTVTGTGSNWSVGNSLTVGEKGAGTLNVKESGSVISAAANIGNELGSDGNVTVTGAGSSWRNTSQAYIGIKGKGTVNVENGGTVSSESSVIGYQSLSDGAVTVSGAGSTWRSLTILVGDLGTGALTIEDGGAVTSDYVAIGAETGTGTVTVTGTGSNWTSSNTLVVGAYATGTLTIADGGEVGVGSSGSGELDVAEYSGSTGTLNIGAAADETAVAAGTLVAEALNFGDGTAALNFNHTETDYEFETPIFGDGTINQIAGVTKLTGDNSGFGGDTNVTGGTLYVNGLLGGVIDVAGGTLGGSGTLGEVTINSGGTLAPGNSVGTLNGASLTLAVGGTYEVELNDGGFTAGTNNDLLNASGAVSLDGGALHVTPENGLDNGSTYTPGTYTIITAGSLTGTFGSVTDDFAFLSFSASYDYTLNEAYLTSSTVTSFCLSGMSANQCLAGGAAFSSGPSSSLFNALVGLSDAAAPAALDLLSGEIHASARMALLEDSRFPREAATDRLRTAFGGVGADGSARTGDSISGSSGLWGQGFGSWGQWDSSGGAAAMDRSIGGILVGGDTPVWDDLRFGVLGGYSRSNFSIDDRASSASADTYTLGVYGGGDWDAFALTGGLAHSWHILDTSRSAAFGNFADSLSASYSARTLQGWGEAAYRLETGAARFEPFANLAYVNLSTDGFTESGGDAALTAASYVADAAFTTLGLRAETGVVLGDTNARLRGMAGWRHAFGGEPTSQMAFASGGDAFAITGVPLAQDLLVLDAGFDVDLTKGAKLGFAYGGLFGSGVQDHSANLNLDVRF